jgi:hypothetical protein
VANVARNVPLLLRMPRFEVDIAEMRQLLGPGFASSAPAAPAFVWRGSASGEADARQRAVDAWRGLFGASSQTPITTRVAVFE